MGLWVITDYVYGDAIPLHPVMPAWVREKTLEVLSDFLAKELVIIGQYVRKENESIFELFPGSSEEIIRKINDEWDKLGANPSLGDVCWIRASEAGVLLARELGLET